MKSIRHTGVAALAALCLFFSLAAGAGESPVPPKKILCTTFPVHQMIRNIIKGSDTIVAELMLPASLGCPHDYALTPLDMAKIAAADILIVNGLGMEEFMGRPVELANPGIVIIDASQNVEGVIDEDEDGDEDGDHHDGDEDEDGDHHDGDEDEDHHDGDDHDHAHGHGPNPHLFTSPALSAIMVENIATRLGELDPAGAALYAANAAAYAERLRRLAGEMAEAAGGFANNRIVEPHGAFDYLARDLDLEIVAHLQPHGQELSASRMLEVLETIREKRPAVIVVEAQYPTKTGNVLAAEAGLPVIRLDSTAAGPDSAPLDHYETVMRDNLSILKEALGGRNP